MGILMVDLFGGWGIWIEGGLRRSPVGLSGDEI
jgi:hypothetical protein